MNEIYLSVLMTIKDCDDKFGIMATELIVVDEQLITKIDE